MIFVKRLLWLLVALLLVGSVVAYNAGPILRWLYPIHYKDVIFRESHKTDVDPYLISAIVRVESNFDPRAVSAKGARGLMQVMPATGIEVAQQLGLDPFDLEQLFEPAVNVTIGVNYLRALMRDFGGNVVLGLAAYNGGPRNVRDWLTQRRWDGTRKSLENVPFPETRDYVERVLRTSEWYRRIHDQR